MKVIYTDAVRAAEEAEKSVNAEFRDMNTLLAESDFISLHVPLLPDTRGLFDGAEVLPDEADRIPDQYLAWAGCRRSCAGGGA